MDIYLVRALKEREEDGTPSWWSNEAGWSDIGQAIVFTTEEQKTLNVPFEGEWVKFQTEWLG